MTNNPYTNGNYLTDESYVLDRTLPKGTIMGANPQPSLIQFCHDNRAVMTIHKDGRIELSDDAKPTEAAAQCIEAMSEMIQQMIKRAVDEALGGKHD